MKATIQWLEDFIDLQDLSPAQVADKLTMAGLEVEDLSDRFAFLNQVVAAAIVSAEPVAGSDHLKVCQVNAGEHGSLTVVCGAPNARPGLVAPLALPGASLPGGLVVRETEIRGLRSQGMLCSQAELSLGPDASQLWELQASCGLSLKELSGRQDWVLEIGITPNRADALSIIGLARDLSAVLNRPLRLPQIELEESGPPIETLASVSIEAPEHALRYVARLIEDVKIGPSPQWLADRLSAVGLRPISNVVDITNYVMLEMGLPLHAFDLDAVAGRRIVVKTYPQGSRFTTLDGQERELKSKTNLMICDGEKPVALAGIMGGLNSEIQPSTRHILLEGACFNATTIRRTSRALGLSTDASYRYERGCDPEICARATARAISLMRQLAGGRVASGCLDLYPRPFKPIEVKFSPARCNAYLGTAHKAEDMSRVLRAIGLKLEGDGPELTASLPSWRPDLSREVDVWEEVARLLDFDSLPATLPRPPATRQAPPPTWTLRSIFRSHLTGQGFSESITYSFINPNFARKLGASEDSPWRQRLLPIINPLSEEQAALRPLMTPSLLNALRLNQSYGRRQTALFEQGAIFLSNGLERQPDERFCLGGVWSGFLGSGRWCDPERPVDFWDLKGVVESLAERLNLSLRFHRQGQLPAWYEPAEAALIDWEGQAFGHLGRLGQKAARAFGLKEVAGPVYLFEIDAQLLIERGLSRPVFRGWSKFPPAERDMALVLDETVAASELVDIIKAQPDIPLAEVFIFDLYQGSQLPKDKKSLALRLIFQSPERTLTDEEVSSYFDAISAALASRCGAALRS